MKRCLLLWLLATPAFAETWTSDSDGSLKFEARFEGEALPGEFPDFSVHYGDDGLVVRVRLAASDMGDPEMNAILHDPVWLAVGEYGSARFHSKRIECEEGARCIAYGELSLKGKTQALDIAFNWRTDGDSATMQGEVTLDRSDFGVGSGEWSSGESIALQVTVSFDIRLEREE